MSSDNRFVKFVSKVWGNPVFLILFLFNLLSNGVAVTTYPDALSIFYIVCISALSATIESLICKMFGNTMLRKIVFYCLITAHLVMTIVDIFLYANFKMIFTQDTIGILAETTAEESQAFLTTYLNVWNVLFIIAAIVLTVWLAFWIGRKLARKLLPAFVSMLLSLIGVGIYGQMAYSHVFHGEGGNSVSQLHSFTRLGFSFLSFRGTYANIQVMRDVNRAVEASLKQQDPPSIIVIIGESFSLYHSSLYGYSKPTNPRLAARVNDGSMTLFDDVISSSDHTGVVMSEVFRSYGSQDPSTENVLFPTCFRKAGYKTALLDNQYFVRTGFSWLTDRVLSELMFDYRNPEKLGLDINLISAIPDFPDPQMIIVHLFGQHFTYSDRYSPEYKRFTPDDYSADLTPEEREVAAHYDNATLYNDYVVDSIISKFEDRNCMVIYFSDHGEEIYEIDDFMGHGNANKRPTILYQVRVPFMIWTSPIFRERYPDVAKRIEDSKHKPFVTDHLPHFLFEVAGIDTKCYCPELSFIDDGYDASKPRIILGSVDYDKAKKETAVKPRY